MIRRCVHLERILGDSLLRRRQPSLNTGSNWIRTLKYFGRCINLTVVRNSIIVFELDDNASCVCANGIIRRGIFIDELLVLNIDSNICM